MKANLGAALLATAIMLPSSVAHAAKHLYVLDKPFSTSVTINPGTKVTLTAKDGVIAATLANSKKQVFFEESDPVYPDKNQGLIQTGDYNFDGHTDIAIGTGNGYGGVNIFSQIFTWNPKTKKFDEGPEVSNFEVNPKTRTIISSHRSGPFWHRDTYRTDGLKLYKAEEVVGPGNVELVIFYDKSGKERRRIVADPNRPEGAPPTPAVLKITTKRAYFHTKPEEAARTKVYIIKGDKVTILDVSPYRDWLKVEFKAKKTYVRWIKAETIDTGE